METPEEFLEQLNIDPKKFVTVRQELGASSGSAYMLKDLLEDYAKLKNNVDIGDVSFSLRDQIAMQALSGMYASHANPQASSPIHSNVEEDAKHCYKIANALLKARSES